MQLCEGKQDPSLAMRNSALLPRSSSWREGEVVRLAKAASCKKYCGLAVSIAFALDTQLSPADLRG
jgi:hypothetical protein